MKYFIAALAFLSLVYSVEISWYYSIGFEADRFERGIKILPGSLTFFYIVGNTYKYLAGHFQQFDCLLLKFDFLSQETIWVRRFNSGSEDVAVDGDIDSQGFIYIAGDIKNVNGNFDFLLLKYSPAGELVGQYSYGDSLFDDFLTDFVISEQNDLYLSGYTYNPATKFDWWILKLNNSGEILWSARYNSPANDDDIARALLVDAFNNVYVTGGSSSGDTNSYAFLTIKYSPQGETLWTRRYESPFEQGYEEDISYLISSDKEGNVIICGEASGLQRRYDFCLIKYSPQGETLWRSRYNNHLVNGVDFPTAMAVDKKGNIYVGGSSTAFAEDLDYAVAKFSSTGALLWARVYNFEVGEDDSLTNLILDKQGNVYVTGYTRGGESPYEMVTLKYSPTGRRIWVDIFSTEADDQGFFMFLDKNEDIYITGNGEAYYHDDLVIVKYTENDVGPVEITAPLDTFRLYATVIPQAKIKNFGGIPKTCGVRFEISNIYFSELILEIEPYKETLLTFQPYFLRDPGNFPTRVYTFFAEDEDRLNDTAYGCFFVTPAWVLISLVPEGAKKKAVKDGGSLASAHDSLLFVLKGNNTFEFYSFSLKSRKWRELCSIPLGARKKRIKKGAALACDGDSLIYALKGNNTREFWVYNILRNTWQSKRDIPSGPSGKNLKGGSRMVYVKSHNRIYATKGSNTLEFFAYDCLSDSWFSCAPVPGGPKNKKVGYGSALAYDGADLIYLTKAKTQEFYAYSISQNSWVSKKAVPFSAAAPRKTYVKDGGSLVFHPLNQTVYLIKGGNKQEFFGYFPNGDSWKELESLPRGPSKKAVKDGADLTYADLKLYALKGNKSNELWMYSANIPQFGYSFNTQPLLKPKEMEETNFHCLIDNPIIKRNLRFILYSKKSSLIKGRIYNICGQVLQTFYLNTEKGYNNFEISLRLPNGTYLFTLTYEAGALKERIVKKIVVKK